MADTFTAILNLTKPEVGASTDTWGTKVNADLDVLDGLFQAGPALKLANGGTGATTAAGARTNLGLGSDATGSNLSALTNAATARTNLGLGAMATVASVALNGDLSGTGTNTISATLANSGVAAGTYTNATVTVDAKGRVTSASSGAGSAPTTAQVLAATAGATAGAVGTYATANMSPSGTIAVGATTAGSNLRGINSSGSFYSPGFSGTWRNMGSSQYEPAGYAAAIPLFLRIS